MTDKELRKLKRSELLELMFYLREELDKLKEENESLKIRIDDLSKVAIEAKNNLSDELIKIISDAVKNSAENYFGEKNQQNPVSSYSASEETGQ